MLILSHFFGWLNSGEPFGMHEKKETSQFFPAEHYFFPIKISRVKLLLTKIPKNNMWEDVAVLKSILPSANKTKNPPFIVNATKKKGKAFSGFKQEVN